MSFANKHAAERLLTAIACAFLLGSSGVAQESPLPQEGRPLTLDDISHRGSWPHIGSPPGENVETPRRQAWPVERGAFYSALGALRLAWTGKIPGAFDELRFQVNQYEDFVLTVTSSGGYGNLVLADSGRRLSLLVTSYFAVLHPSDRPEIAQLLGGRRVRLLECPATIDMIRQELNIAPPPGGWRISERRADLESILRSNGSTVAKEAGRLLISPPGPEKLLAKRDVNLLLMRLAYDEELELSTL
jgi:hypothetical protein